VDAVFDSADGNFQLVGYLVVLEAPKMHHEGRFVRCVQRFNGAVDIFQRKSRVSLIIGAVVGCINIVKVVSGVDEGLPPYHPLVIGNKGILHDCVQPSFQVGAIGVFITVGERFQHCVLQQIVRIFGIAREPQGKGTQRLGDLVQIVGEFESSHNE